MNRVSPLWDLAGWFGKIPALGDFVTRGLPQGFVEPWDAWLSNELFDAQSSLGDVWTQSFAAMPVHCFLLGGGVIDARQWLGVLLPSADRVGREFPLTLAVAGHGVIPAPTVPWWQALAGVGKRALAPDCSADELDKSLAEVLASHSATWVPASTKVESGTSTWWRFDPDSAPMEFTGLPRGADFRQLIQGFKA